ncbi:MAG: MoxR family ATPase [Sandaracinus sp.]|nr:MoxR family ATPase [Sandaracinus sp.]
MTRLALDDLAPGRTFEATFLENDAPGSRFRWRTTQLDGRRTPKVVLSDDARIQAGVPCVVRVVHVGKPESETHGHVEVVWERAASFRIEGVWLDPSVARKLEVLLESGMNILLDGPQGCGKTTLARAVATQLGMEFVFFNCGAVVDASDFFATIQVRASESGAPVTDFVKTEILEAIERAASSERRVLVFLDELNRCPEAARNALMPALDSTRRVFHPIDNRFVAIPDHVQFVAAVNRGRQFSATFGLDAAQLDRFAPLRMGYPPPAEEVKILKRRHADLPTNVIERVVLVADAVRRSPEVGSGLSVRATDEACTYLAHPRFGGGTDDQIRDVLRTSFCLRFDGDADDVTTDAGAVWTIVEQQLRVANE